MTQQGGEQSCVGFCRLQPHTEVPFPQGCSTSPPVPARFLIVVLCRRLPEALQPTKLHDSHQCSWRGRLAEVGPPPRAPDCILSRHMAGNTHTYSISSRDESFGAVGVSVFDCLI